MKILVFSDVHGNLPAFEAMLKHEGSFDSYICLGDLVNYGPWSNECVDLALSLPSCKYIIGNHEEAFINGYYSGQSKLVKTFFEICSKDFYKLEEIKRFREEFIGFGYCFRHTIQNSYIYPDTQITLDSNYVIGHSHHQFFYRNRGYNLYNTGSVGQNRKFINIINYIVLETEELIFDFCAIKYNVDLFINEIKHRKYPQVCIDYYATKERA